LPEKLRGIYLDDSFLNRKPKHSIGNFNRNSFPIHNTKLAQQSSDTYIRLVSALGLVKPIAMFVAIRASLNSDSSRFTVKETKHTRAITQEFCARLIKKQARSPTDSDKRLSLDTLFASKYLIAH
jgi:hypothetical protein